MKKIAIFIILFISAFFRAIGARACRFHPSCSRYAAQAFERHGFAKALWLTVKRIMRCQPFSQGGVDPLIGKV